eukprot:2377401-Pleurochrysis_carterae.AAC.2
MWKDTKWFMRQNTTGIALAKQAMAGVDDYEISRTGSRLIRQGVPRGEDTMNLISTSNDERECLMKAKII